MCRLLAALVVIVTVCVHGAAEDSRTVQVKDPSGFHTAQEEPVYSGPQPGERLPAFIVRGLSGEFEDQSFDPSVHAEDGLSIFVFQDENGVGFRGLIDLARKLEVIRGELDEELFFLSVFLSDDPMQLMRSIRPILEYIPDGYVVGISGDGRDGPGNLGLNRNMAMTILLVKDAQIVHNFTFPQSMLRADPHVLGGIADLIGQDSATVAAWLEEAESERMQMRMERDESVSREEIVRRFDKDGDGELSEEEGRAAREAMAERTRREE